ncbi:MAG: ABC transporter permease [Spirochaetaceae bacterium]|jgi:lipoprotein-releasing system permease protein|nr:ABC transporter permease [Spirochaetaceae bacterium]
MKKEKKINIKWLGFVACRYTSKKASRSSASSMLCILEIAAGVLALTVIIAVMNGLQLGYIESILEVSSYYVRVDDFPRSNLNMIERIQDIDGVRSVVPFKEIEGIARGDFSVRQSPLVLRGLPPSAFSTDSGMKEHLEIIESAFSSWGSAAGGEQDLLTQQNEILLGSELARTLGLGLGDRIEFLSMSDLFSTEAYTEDSAFIITGIFKSGYYEYDLGWGFINIDRARALSDSKDTVTLGIKIQNRYQDLKTAAAIEALINQEIPRALQEASGLTVSSWRDYNKAFFGALRTEKLMMFVLVGLIFIVVALNIFQGQRRSVLERSEEIGLLRAIGAGDFQVRCIFAFNGLLIGLIGASAGMALALLLCAHIQGFFSLIENLVGFFLNVLYHIRYGDLANDANFAIFNRKIFYLDSITARIMVSDLVIIYLFGLLSAVFAAWFASKRIAKIKPAEVLRYE